MRSFPSECFRTKKNLKPEQTVFDRLWRQLQPVQTGRKDMPYCGVFFKPAVTREFNGRGRVVPFGPDRLVVRANEVLVGTLQRVPTKNWRGAYQNRQFRFNLAEIPPQIVDGEIHVSAGLFPPQSRIWQADLSMNPLQDGPLVEPMSWSPDQLIPQPAELPAIMKGRVRTRVDDLYRDVEVDGVVIYRFPRQTPVEMLVKPDEQVQEDQPIVRLLEKVTYGRVTFYPDGSPRWDRVSPPVVSVTRKRHTLRAALLLLDRMVQASVLHPNDPDRPHVPVPSSWAPVHMAEFSHDLFYRLRDAGGWSESLELKSELRRSLGPGGDFYITSQCPEPMRSVRVDRVSDETLVVFAGASGEITVRLPKSAQILPAVKAGQVVMLGDPVADWIPRQYYEDVQAVRQLLGQSWPHAIDELVRHLAVSGPEIGRDDAEMLIDARFVAAGSLNHAKDAWFNFQPARQYLDPDSGIIVPAPIPQNSWKDMMFFLGGIGYDLTPCGDLLTESPLTEKRLHKAGVSS